MEHTAVFTPCSYSPACFSCNSGKHWSMRKKSRYPGNTFLHQNLKGTLHQLDERLWKPPCLSDFCVTTKITGASSQRAMSHVREPWQCQAAVHHNLAEVPCSVTYFLKLFSEKLQMGSRLIFARLDRRQCHCSPPLEMVRLPCCVLWSWTWSSECTLDIQKSSGSLTCCLCACPGWAAALMGRCCSACCLLQ